MEQIHGALYEHETTNNVLNKKHKNRLQVVTEQTFET